jgi:hypothetical protein
MLNNININILNQYMSTQNNIILKYLNKNNKLLHNNSRVSKTNAYYSISSNLKTILFHEKYPDLSFCDLKKQNDYCSTDDNCIYYKHILTNNIYSWNYILKKWM